MDSDTMFQPWFIPLVVNFHAFKILDYKAFGGGANADGSGKKTSNSVDLAILTVDTSDFFKSINVDIDNELLRLEWVTEEKDRIKGRFEMKYDNLTGWSILQL